MNPTEKEFNFNPLDGDWFENPLAPSENLNLLGETERIEFMNTDNTSSLYFTDNFSGQAFQNNITEKDTYDMGIGLEETYEPDGCQNLKIACLILGFIVLLILVFVIVTAYLNGNDVVCQTENVYCPPCPVCPTSAGDYLEKFYLRDRVSNNKIFMQKNNYIVSWEGKEGLQFTYDESNKMITSVDTGFYLYIDENSYIRISTSQFEKNNFQKEFMLEGKTIFTADLEYKIAIKDGFLYAYEQEEKIPYTETVALFKENPNQMFSL